VTHFHGNSRGGFVASTSQALDSTTALAFTAR
jgi:hypothetical protein